jgi:hypothetical protein
MGVNMKTTVRKMFIIGACIFLVACTQLPAVQQPVSKTTVEDRSGMVVGTQSIPKGELVSCPEFYTEVFNGSKTQGCWVSNPPLIVTSTKNDQVTLSPSPEGINLVINAPQTDAYVFYSGGIYPDINLQATITSHGVNNHEAALVCRANDKGWYEARVSTSGFFSIYRYDSDKRVTKKNPYTNYIGDTSSTAINTGNDKSNVFQFLCDGNNLILYINGTEVFNKPVADQIEPGLVGVGGLSQENYPVNLTFGNILIGKP